jgi:hypothetical protein
MPGTTFTRNLRPGHSYRFRVRAVDRAGNQGGASYSSKFRLTAVSQSTSAVSYQGRLTTSTSTAWWGGTAKSSSAAGATASYTFTGRSIAWIGLRGPNRGRAQVLVNGALVATVDLFASKYLKQRVIWSASWTGSITRTVVIKVLGTSGSPRVDLDGFAFGS